MDYSKFTNKNTIVFDLDGTLVNMQKSTSKAHFYALTQFYGKNIPFTHKQLKTFIGKPFSQSLAEYGIHPAEILALDKLYIQAKTQFAHHDYLMSNAHQLLSSLKKQGKTLILATNKRRIFAQTVLQKFNLEKYFTTIICKDDGDFESKADMLASLGLNLNDTLIYGNMQSDILPNATFIRSLSKYGDIILESIITFAAACKEPIRNIFATRAKYKLDGFT